MYAIIDSSSKLKGNKTQREVICMKMSPKKVIFIGVLLGIVGFLIPNPKC